MMHFYTGQHRFYCGVDLHTRTLSLCVLDQAGGVALEATLPPEPDRFLEALAPFRDGLVVGCECLFAWYWLADLCAAEGIPFVLGHALYLKAIHGGKTKTDTIDARKLARLLRGGNFTQAYVYPKAMRAIHAYPGTGAEKRTCTVKGHRCEPRHHSPRSADRSTRRQHVDPRPGVEYPATRSAAAHRPAGRDRGPARSGGQR